MASHAAPPKPTRWFAVGGPLFNLAMVVVLMAISAFIVASPAEPGVDAEQIAAGGDAPFGGDGPAPAFLSFADSDEPTVGPAEAPSPTPAAESATDAGGDGGSDGGGGGSPDDGGSRPGGGAGRNGQQAPPWVEAPERFQPVVYQPVPAATPLPTATPVPTATPTPRPTATPEPTATPRPRPTPRPTPTPVPLPRCEDFADQPSAQAVYDANPSQLVHMDGDRDGLACEHLPAPPPPPVPSKGQVMAATGIYGMHTRDAPWWMGEIDHLARVTGRTPGTLLFFSNFALNFPSAAIDTAWRRNMIPIVAWEPIIPGAPSQPKLRQIIDGDFDPYLDAWATAAKADGRPIVLRFAAEMNGNWYPWSESVNGNQTGEFVQVWRHIHDRFEAVGADNVIWLWSVNRVNNLSTQIVNFYPGDEYVDWVGLSGYLRQVIPGVPVGFSTTFDRTLSDLRALTDKPILLAEIGAGTDEANKTAWIRSLFQGMAAAPDIIGFVWFNDQKSGGDWRLQVSQGVVDAFADGVADPRWRSGIDPGGMVPGQRLPVRTGGGGS